MRHVGQELRLVLGGQRELSGLLLQAAARQLDLVILQLDVAVLLDQEPRLLVQLVVRLPERLGLLLKLLGETLARASSVAVRR